MAGKYIPLAKVQGHLTFGIISASPLHVVSLGQIFANPIKYVNSVEFILHRSWVY